MEETDAKLAIPNMDANFVDDDDLQAVLARSRRRKVMKPRRMAPEEIAQQGTRLCFCTWFVCHGGLYCVLVIASRTEDEDQQNGGPQNLSGLTLDDTSEFVRGINFTPAEVKQEPIIVKIDTSHMREASEDEEKEGEAIAEFEGASVDDEPMDYDEETDAMLRAIEQSMAHQGAVSVKEDEKVEEVRNYGFRSLPTRSLFPRIRLGPLASGRSAGVWPRRFISFDNKEYLPIFPMKLGTARGPRERKISGLPNTDTHLLCVNLNGFDPKDRQRIKPPESTKTVCASSRKLVNHLISSRTTNQTWR